MNYLELTRIASGEILLTLTALAVLGVDLNLREAKPPSARWRIATTLGIVGCGLTLAWLCFAQPNGEAPGGMLVSDAVTRMVKCVVLLLLAGTLGMSRRATFSAFPGEYVSVALLGGVGMLLIVGSGNLLVMFLSLELASIALYILTGFDRGSPRSTEAALKYFLFGGMAGAFLLFGSSLVYGSTGAVEFRQIAGVLRGTSPSSLLLTGLIMVLVGLGFKVAAAPFHFWAPDAYQGAPTPTAALIASGSKVAAFFIIAKFSVVALAGVAGAAAWGAWKPGWVPLVAIVAALSMLVGNFAALAQRNVKRLLAYSAVAHAGYTLVAVVAGGTDSLASATFYAATYALTSLGAFGVVLIAERCSGGSDFEHFAGLSRRSPVLALCLAVFVLSLAGIPPLVGFFGKFYLFLTALKSPGGTPGLLWLVGLAAGTTCVSFYYYLRLLKVAFVHEPAPGTASTSWPEAGIEFAIVVAAAVVVVTLGCLPAILLAPLQQALVAVGL